RSTVSQRLRLEHDWHVDANLGELAALSGIVGMSLERLAALGRERRRRREDRVERPVRGDQLTGALLADPGHAFDVVDAVSHQRQPVYALIGPDAELLEPSRRVVPRAFVARVVHADAVSDELEEVLVARDDRDVEPRLMPRPCQGSDDVIGLVAF